MILHFAYIGVALMALALIAAWMFVVSRRHLLVRVLGAVAALALAVAIWTNLGSLMGYAVAARPAGRVQLIAMFDDPAHGKIDLWVRQADGPRAYTLPWSAELAKLLIAATGKVKCDGGKLMLSIDGQDDHRDASGEAGISGVGRDGAGHRIKVDVIPLLPPKT